MAAGCALLHQGILPSCPGPLAQPAASPLRWRAPEGGGRLLPTSGAGLVRESCRAGRGGRARPVGGAAVTRNESWVSRAVQTIRKRLFGGIDLYQHFFF